MFNKLFKMTLDMSGNDVIVNVSLAFDHSAALKRFKQTIFVALTKFAATQILSQDMMSDRFLSCKRNEKIKRLHLSTNTRAQHATSRSHSISMAWRKLCATNSRKICCNYCHSCVVRSFLSTEYSSAVCFIKSV